MEQDEELWRTAAELRRAAMRLARRMRMERPEVSVPSQELSVLGHLNRRGPMTPGEIAVAERVQPQTLTRTLAALEGRGEILRRADIADRRRSVLSITGAGVSTLAADMHQRDSWLAIAMAHELTPAERRMLMLAGELMERLAESDASTLAQSDMSTPLAEPDASTPLAEPDASTPLAEADASTPLAEADASTPLAEADASTLQQPERGRITEPADPERNPGHARPA